MRTNFSKHLTQYAFSWNTPQSSASKIGGVSWFSVRNRGLCQVTVSGPQRPGIQDSDFSARVAMKQHHGRHVHALTTLE